MWRGLALGLIVLVGCSSSSGASSPGDSGQDAIIESGGDTIVDATNEGGDAIADDCAPSGPSDAACPPLIDVSAACPCNCFRTQPPQRWDPTRKCLEPATDEICTNDGCATA